MLYTAHDLKVKRKYKEHFSTIYKGEVVTANAQSTSFRVYYYDSRTYKRKLRVSNSEDSIQFMFDDEFCIFWTITIINGEKVFVYWSWPENQGCPD